MPGQHPLRDFSALLLCKCGHNGETELPIAIHGPDIVLHKVHFYTIFFQFSNSDKSINGIPSKSAYFTSHDQVKSPLLCIGQHFHKCRALLSLSPCDSLINIAVHYRPVRVILSLILVPFHLISERCKLSLMFRRDAAIKDHFPMPIPIQLYKHRLHISHLQCKEYSAIEDLLRMPPGICDPKRVLINAAWYITFFI